MEMAIKRSISDLPEELLVLIFSFYVSSEGHFKLMKNINNVCMKWSKVCKFSSLWKSVDDRMLTTKELVSLSKRGLLRNTTKLNLKYMRISPKNYAQLSEIIGNCDNLQFLDLSGSNIRELMTRYVAQKCKHLKSLKLDNMKIPKFYFYRENHEIEETNRVFESFIEVCGRNLVYLSLSNIGVPVCSSVLSRLPKECHNLEELHVSSYLESLCMTVSEFQEGCPKLRVLEIFFCKFNCTGANATNGFPHLEVFVSNRCRKLGDSELYQLLGKSTNLHTLGVNSSCVSCEGLLKIPAENIQRLYVSETFAIRSSDFNKVISRWKFTLKELDLSLMSHEQQIDKALSSLWENNFCSALEKLNLEGSRVKALTLAILLRKCKHLRYLNVKCCPELPVKEQKIYRSPDEFEILRSTLSRDYPRNPKSFSSFPNIQGIKHVGKVVPNIFITEPC